MATVKRKRGQPAKYGQPMQRSIRVMVPDELAGVIDAARGQLSLSAWVRQAIERAANAPAQTDRQATTSAQTPPATPTHIICRCGVKVPVVAVQCPNCGRKPY